MATKKKDAGLNAPAKKKEVNYVIIHGEKVAKRWVAFQNNLGMGKIVDLRAVLK